MLVRVYAGSIGTDSVDLLEVAMMAVYTRTGYQVLHLLSGSHLLFWVGMRNKIAAVQWQQLL